MEWKSYHIFINNYDAIDEFIKNDLRSIIDYLNNYIEKWFFIRYWQGGPHVRLRYLEKDVNSSNVICFIEGILKKYEKYEFLISDLVNDKKLANFEKTENISWYKNLSVQSIPYVAEYDRYGGCSVMNLSEDIFMESSKFVLHMVEKIPFNQRIIISFDMMLLTFKEVFKEDLYKYIKYYEAYWERYGNKEIFSAYESAYCNVLKNRFMTIQKNNQNYLKIYGEYLNFLNKKYEEIKKHQTTYKKEYEYGILFSHVHMNNNRLGIFPEIEYFLSKMILKLEGEILGGVVES